MAIGLSELEATSRLAISALIGLGVGLEREWSGHTTGPNARFAGLRTFSLLGATGGVAGLLLANEYEYAGAAVIAGGSALCVVAYLASVRRVAADVDGTTEAAALVVVALGVIAGLGWLALAAGAGSLTVLALSEKTRLHWLVRHLTEAELRGALQFAVLALVVLPLLPSGPFTALSIRPRSLWAIVLFFCGLNFFGFLARRAVGPNAGVILTGMVGGLMSSTGVTLDFARRSRREPTLGSALGYGVVGACTVLVPRIIVVSSVLNHEVAIKAAWILALPALCGAAITWLGRARVGVDGTAEVQPAESPLRLRSAIQMSVAFQASLIAIALVGGRWGTAALYPTAAVLGLTDMDALTVSMSRVDVSTGSAAAAMAIGVGVVANTLLKLGLAASLGVSHFRRTAVASLAAMAMATVLGMIIAARFV
jgi:uncharacterized membrane protein (DUF4010 family)